MASPSFDPEKRYKNRPESIVVVNLSLDRQAARLLKQYGDNRRSHGRFVSQLIRDYAKQQAETDQWEKTRKAIQRLRTDVIQEIRKQDK